LSERLKEMVKDGLARRRVDSRATPARVYYSLSEKGSDSCEIIESLKEYGLKWGGKKTLNCEDMDCELCFGRREGERVKIALARGAL
jgi:DNA-binding HxlR family transcriptional regulator